MNSVAVVVIVVTIILAPRRAGNQLALPFPTV
jgi:hypothetical protein